MSVHEPAGWIDRVPTMQVGPGVHQLRLITGWNNTNCVVGCACGAKLGTIPWGGDHWAIYREHEAQQ